MTDIQTTTPDLPEEHSPRRKKRKFLLDDNEGDFRVMLVHPGGPAFSLPNQPEIPKGTLFPLNQYPGFKNSTEAQRYIQKRSSQHTETLNGQVLAIVKYSQIIRLELVQALQVTIGRKPKREVDETPDATVDTHLP